MKSWDQFEKELCKIDAPALSTLREPASVEEIESLETVIDQRLSPELRELLLLHNGQQHWFDDGEMTPMIFGVCHFNGVDEIADHHASLCESLEEGFLTYDTEVEDPELRQGGQNWRREWIPFGELTFEITLLTDLAPGVDGTVGQVFMRSNEHNLSNVLAPSIGDFLSRYARWLASKGQHPCLWTSSFSDGE